MYQISKHPVLWEGSVTILWCFSMKSNTFYLNRQYFTSLWFFYFARTLNHADFKIHVNALKAVKMESHMKMLDFASMLWREVTEATYDFRRHHRECEHLNFLTLSKVSRLFWHQTFTSAFLNNVLQVRQFYRTYIHAEGAHRRKLTLSIAPDPTLNTIQVSWIPQSLERWP